jgi:hypothetical protein
MLIVMRFCPGGHPVQVGDVSETFDHLDLDHPFAFALLRHHNMLGISR